jgi:hypothetical protein
MESEQLRTADRALAVAWRIALLTSRQNRGQLTFAANTNNDNEQQMTT